MESANCIWALWVMITSTERLSAEKNASATLAGKVTTFWSVECIVPNR